MNSFNEQNYIKPDEENIRWRKKYSGEELENRLLQQRGFSYDDRHKLSFNHAVFIQYAMTRFNALNNNEKIYFYNNVNKCYEQL